MWSGRKITRHRSRRIAKGENGKGQAGGNKGKGLHWHFEVDRRFAENSARFLAFKGFWHWTRRLSRAEINWLVCLTISCPYHCQTPTLLGLEQSWGNDRFVDCFPCNVVHFSLHLNVPRSEGVGCRGWKQLVIYLIFIAQSVAKFISCET